MVRVSPMADTNQWQVGSGVLAARKLVADGYLVRVEDGVVIA
jgi:hypothetical protein